MEKGSTTGKQLKDLKLACRNMKCLIVVGERVYSQAILFILRHIVYISGPKMMCGRKTRCVWAYEKCATLLYLKLMMNLGVFLELH